MMDVVITPAARPFEEPNVGYSLSCKYLYIHKRISFLRKKKIQNMFRDKYKMQRKTQNKNQKMITPREL